MTLPLLCKQDTERNLSHHIPAKIHIKNPYVNCPTHYSNKMSELCARTHELLYVIILTVVKGHILNPYVNCSMHYLNKMSQLCAGPHELQYVIIFTVVPYIIIVYGFV